MVQYYGTFNTTQLISYLGQLRDARLFVDCGAFRAKRIMHYSPFGQILDPLNKLSTVVFYIFAPLYFFTATQKYHTQHVLLLTPELSHWGKTFAMHS